MLRRFLRSKIHRATITAADLHYEGSLTLDTDLLRAADIAEYEEVQVVNINNGERLLTYILPGEAGSGMVRLNGAAARLGCPGDLVIIMAFATIDATELTDFQPAVVFVDSQNRIVENATAPAR